MKWVEFVHLQRFLKNSENSRIGICAKIYNIQFVAIRASNSVGSRRSRSSYLICSPIYKIKQKTKYSKVLISICSPVWLHIHFSCSKRYIFECNQDYNWNLNFYFWKIKSIVSHWILLNIINFLHRKSCNKALLLSITLLN